MKKIPIAKTTFTKADMNNILKPLNSGWVVQGPFVKEFEDKWCNFTNAKYSIATTSCTTALHLALSGLGIKKDDEVIIPSLTWIATANVLEMLGAKPIFCDVSDVTFNIDPLKVEELITAKTKAIIPVHLFGLSAEMDKIMKIANKHKLLVIEDAACGFASKFKGVHVGNFGNAGCFSFHPRKAITTGEGGMITTTGEKLNTLFRALRDHGATMSDLQRHQGNKPYLLPEFPYAGFNYRMTDIQASIGSTQMDRAEEIYLKRKKIAHQYDEALQDISWLRTPFAHADYIHGYQSYVCMFMPDDIAVRKIPFINKKRNDFMEYLQANGISTRPGTHAVHMLEYYARKYEIGKTDFINSMKVYLCSVSLPVYESLSGSDIDYITKIIKAFRF